MLRHTYFENKDCEPIRLSHCVVLSLLIVSWIEYPTNVSRSIIIDDVHL